MNPQHIVYLSLVLVGVGIGFSAWNPLKPDFEMNVIELDFFSDNKSFYLDCSADDYICKYRVDRGIGYWYVSTDGENWFKVTTQQFHDSVKRES